MNSIYIEAFSGITEEMFLGALSALAENPPLLETLPSRLHLPGIKVFINETVVKGIACTSTKAVLPENKQINGFGKNHYLSHKEAIGLLQDADLNKKTKTIGKEILNLIREAENRIYRNLFTRIYHRKTLNVKSFVEITAIAWLLASLDIEKVFATPVCTGFGYLFHPQKGKMPVPTPVTVELLRGIPFYTGDERGERTTPAGAAILKYLHPEFDIPPLVTSKSVYGSGEKDYPEPNVLRVSSVEEIKDNTQAFVFECVVSNEKQSVLKRFLAERLTLIGIKNYYYHPVNTGNGKKGTLFSCQVIGKDLNRLSGIVTETFPEGQSRYYPVKQPPVDKNSRLTGKVLENNSGSLRVSRHLKLGNYSRS